MAKIKKIDTNEVIKLRKQGISYINIAKILGIWKGTVSYHLKKAKFQNGIRFTNNKQDIYSKLSEIKKDYVEGKLSLEKISLKYNIKRATLTVIFRKNGIELRNNNETRAYLRQLGLYKKCNQKGQNNSNWRGGKTRLKYHGYTEEEYLAWRKSVLERDNYTCQECSKRWELNAHHIIPTRMDKTKVLDVDNGITLCETCHEKTYMKELLFANRYFSLIQNIAKAGV